MYGLSGKKLAGIIDKMCAEGKYKLADLIKELREYGHGEIADVLEIWQEKKK